MLSHVDFAKISIRYVTKWRKIHCYNLAQEATDIAVRIRRLKSLRVAYEIHVLQVLVVVAIRTDGRWSKDAYQKNCLTQRCV